MDSMINMLFLILLGGLTLVWVVDAVKRKQAQPKPRNFELQPEVKQTAKVQPINLQKLSADSPGTTEDVSDEFVAQDGVAPVSEAALVAESEDLFVVPEPTVESEPVVEEEMSGAAIPEPVIEDKRSWIGRIRQGLGKTRSQLTENLATLFASTKTIDHDLLEEIETLLLTADVGIEATSQIIGTLTQKLARKQLKDSQALHAALKEELTHLLEPCIGELALEANSPFVILVVGVNGVGKTTTIGKLAKRFQQQGKSVLLAAGDTFRAAAVEQLQVWGERNQVPVVAQHTGADSASVIFDAVQAAKSRKIDVIIADTAGRLQNKDNLMAELEKVVRVIKKQEPEAPHEVLLVLDAGTGQNALSQAQIFRQAVGVTGIALTKLDGTAKGGILFAIAKQHQLPIRYIGVGEGIDDLRPFQANEFVEVLFDV